MKNDTLDILQLDSLTKADKLPGYNKWIKTPIKDGDDNNVYEYSTLYDKTKENATTISVIVIHEIDANDKEKFLNTP